MPLARRLGLRNIPRMEIHWEDPPADVLFRHENRGGKYVEYALAARDNPGRWLTLPPESATTKGSASGLAQAIRLGSTKGFKPKGAFEAVWAGVRSDPEDPESPEVYKVYVKFVGDPSPADESGEGGGTAPSPPPAPGNGNGSDDDPPPDHADKPSGETARGVIRQWARENGWPDVAQNGRLPEGVLDAYDRAHQQTE